MRKALTVMAITVVMAISTITMASAGVERYQFTDVIIDIDSVNGTTNYWHDYTFRHNPCQDEWTVSRATGSQGPETVTDISINGNQVTYTSDYDDTTYVYTATIAVDDSTGTLSLVAANGGVNDVAGFGSISQTSYNHGEYVAESIDDYGPDAHSCIGKPIVGNGK